MAQLVEEVSVLVADRRRKDPRTIERPWEKNRPRKPVEGVVTTGEGGVTATGLGGMLAATQMRGAVVLG